MAGSDRSKMRDNPWDPLAGNGRWRVWNSRRGKPSWPAVTSRINRPDIWMQAIRSDPQKTLVARGPSTYGSRRAPRRQATTLPNRLQPGLDRRAARLEERRQRELLAQRRQRLVGRKAGAVGCDLEQDAVG